MARYRLACATIFDMEFDFDTIKPSVQWFCKGREVAPTTGKEHWQCVFYSTQAKRETGWRKLLKPHHVKMCKGNLLQNETYCQKEGQWEEWGTKPMGDGHRRDILVVKEQIDAGKSVHEVMEEPALFEPCLRYKRGLTEYQNYVRLKTAKEVGYKKKDIYIIVGPTGQNKTRFVYDEHGYSRVYAMPDNKGQWAGSYDGQPVVLFDDVHSGDIMSIAHFLRITDGYPYEYPVKGGFVAWTPTAIYFTSNQPFANWWPSAAPEHLAAAARRVTDIKNLYPSAI